VSWFYRNLIRRALFLQNPEKIHQRTMWALGLASHSPRACGVIGAFFGAPDLPVDLWGMKFPNPIGMAAGMDKVGEAMPVWPHLGLGFSELGAVTWQAQPGNPQPRLFRAVSAGGIVNRMGFNNDGAEALARCLEKWRAMGLWPHHPVGINLGKSKVTPLDKAPEDYANSLRVLLPYGDFFVVNVSSPNTPNLRQLQDKAALNEILAALQEVRHKHSAFVNPRSDCPILVKVAPDLSFDALDEILELTGPRHVAGIIATNTTISRPQTTDTHLQKVYAETGGLSGRPLKARSTEVIRHIYRQTRGALPIVGVGGIFNGDDAWEKVTAGASLLQIFTSMVYEGPGAAKAIVTGLKARLAQTGLTRLEEAVGLDIK
jgi:dihydroorotate dehydrogenase